MGSELPAHLAKIEESATFLHDRLGPPPTLAVVFGSGLGGAVEELDILEQMPYSEIPFFHCTTVPGHRGDLALAAWQNNVICCLRGRLHFYEGLALQQVVFPVRTLAEWGVGNFFLTNAAGAINADFVPGDLMLSCDHINLLGDNPLVGPHLDRLGERFPDMTEPYSRRMMGLVRRAAAQQGVTLRQGVYAAVKGPSYETPAEIRMLRALGADAVGMSTVPEVIALRQLGREVVAVSCITNMAAGVFSEHPNHREVLAMAKRSQRSLTRLALGVSEGMAMPSDTGPVREED